MKGKVVVCHTATDEMLKIVEFDNTEWKEIELTFKTEDVGSYSIGIEALDGTSGSLYVDDLSLHSPYYYAASPSYAYVARPESTWPWLQDHNLRPSASPDTHAGQTLQVIYHLTVNSIDDPASSLDFHPLLQRESLGWATMGEGRYSLKYSEMGTGKVLMVFALGLPDNYDRIADTLSPRLNVRSGIDLVWDKIIIVDEDYKVDESGFDAVIRGSVDGSLRVE